MKAVRLHPGPKLSVEEVPDPSPGPGEVRVAVRAAGVCGTDLHAARGLFPVRDLPVVMGHEGCGAVTAALAAKEERETELEGIQRMLKAIDPALARLDTLLSSEERLQRAVEENVRWSVAQIGRLPEMEGVSESEVMDILVVGAVYEIATGRVRLVE